MATLRRGLAALAAARPLEAALTREFIHAALYARDGGYFSTRGREVLHAPAEAVDFPSLTGEREYRRELARLYAARTEAWLTPVEVFAPHYSRAIASYMLHAPAGPGRGRRLDVFEIGGGSGSNALHILDYLRDFAPDVYEHTSYTIVEISPVMAERQRQRVVRQHPKHCTVINQDILTFADSHPTVNHQCFFLAMEVLDNLPHDKVALENGRWHETLVQTKEEANSEGKYPTLEEVRQPVQDPLIRQTLEFFGCDLPLQVTYKYNSNIARRVRNLLGKQDICLNSAFVPTGAMQLLNTLQTAFPKHHLIAADFDALPPPNLDAKSPIKALDHPLSPTATSEGSLHAGNAPLVASKLTGPGQLLVMFLP